MKLIYDKQEEMLTLRATQGLSENAVGRVQLRLGQGITGLALKELRSICEGIYYISNPALGLWCAQRK